MAERRVQELPVSDVVPNRIRLTSGRGKDMDGLVQSIAELGIQQPLLTLRDGDKYPIIDGDRRWLGAKTLGMLTVPCLVYEELTADDMPCRQLAIAEQRSPFNALEKGRVVEEIMRVSGCSAKDVARKIGKSPSLVSKWRTLTLLSTEAQDAIAREELAMSAGYEIAKANAEHREVLTREALANRFTRSDVIRRAKELASGRPKAKPCARRSPTPRERVPFKLDDNSVSVSGPTLTVEGVIDLLTDLVGRLRSQAASDEPLAVIAKAISTSANCQSEETSR